MNQQAIIGLAITTATYRRDWISDTPFSEMYEDFADIARHAQDYLDWVGIKDYWITEQDVCQALGFGDLNECLAEMAEWDAE